MRKNAHLSALVKRSSLLLNAKFPPKRDSVKRASGKTLSPLTWKPPVSTFVLLYVGGVAFVRTLFRMEGTEFPLRSVPLRKAWLATSMSASGNQHSAMRHFCVTSRLNIFMVWYIALIFFTCWECRCKYEIVLILLVEFMGIYRKGKFSFSESWMYRTGDFWLYVDKPFLGLFRFHSLIKQPFNLHREKFYDFQNRFVTWFLQNSVIK